MPRLQTKYYHDKNDMPDSIKSICTGYSMIEDSPLFSRLLGEIHVGTNHMSTRNSIACVTKKGDIYLNERAHLEPRQWAYVMAHTLLHLAFGHFDKEKMPPDTNYDVWNKACDIYVARFLADIGFGQSIFEDPASSYSIKLNDEKKIYEHLLKTETTVSQDYGLNAGLDMIWLNYPIVYKNGETNIYTKRFVGAIKKSIKEAVSDAGGHDINDQKETIITKAAMWFLTHYPLLGSLASSFKIIESVDMCHKHEIHIAAVDITHGEIYVNPSCGLSFEEWKFVLAHEYLHAGLCHYDRCQGRNPYLWNIACDYVINSWLVEMNIGNMPSEGLLYDETLSDMSAEAVYDIIIRQARKYGKHATFRGYGKGDMWGDTGPRFEGMNKGISLDEFFKNALREGLDYHITHQRGYIPAGLVEEIRALSMPPIAWEVQLARWFDENFPQLEKHRTYARPSRRQGATPDIPRPSYVLREHELEDRTFGVVVDTSGSMCSAQIGLALGAIASYAVSKDVRYVRIIFCDASATDAGYMPPEDIAGRVEVTGRGGTILQPGVDALESARDFPSDGPILVITDGQIEDDLKIKRNHAFLIPHGCSLPFRPKGKVFYMKNKEVDL